ncbi:MAG: 30S ribosomal protein S16 [Hydrotalea sp.]|nr:30S ribosomal protein S16 [Hydrotalea sp.]
MSVRLRLARGGTKKRPYYRLVAATRTRARDGKFLERVGSYNPMLDSKDPARVVIDIERVKYWLSVGAEPSERVAIFLSQHGLVKVDRKEKAKTQTKQNMPRAKTLAKLEEAKKAAEAAAAKPAEVAPEKVEAAAPAAEAPKPAEAPKAEAAPAAEAPKPAEAPKVEAAAPAAETPASEDKPA